MIPTPHIIRLLGEFTPSPTVGRVVKPYGEMPATRPYKPRNVAPRQENETKEDARKRQKRESYAANRDQVLLKQREQKAIKRASKKG